MAKLVRVPKTYHVALTALLLDGRRVTRHGEIHASSLGEALDSSDLDFGAGDDGINADDCRAITIDVREAS